MTFDSPTGAAQRPSADILVDVTSPIATLDLGGGNDRAWFSVDAWRALGAAASALSQRADLKCVVLLGSGRATGGVPRQDVSSDEGLGAAEERALRAGAVAAALRALRGSPHPLVAVVQGACVGWGLEIATCCDVRVCAESARFGAAVDARELAGVYGELRPLVQLLGPTEALEIVLDGGMLGAERALALGLVTRVCPDPALSGQAYGLAARIAGGALLVNRWHKQVVRRLYGKTS
jgi:enoyl-CoA hydratase